MPAPVNTIELRVELFGMPRLRAGRREVGLTVPPAVSRQQLVRALAQACPPLVGHAILGDLTDLQDGYVFNRNGTIFLSGDRFSFQPGDSLLLLSSQAGG